MRFMGGGAPYICIYIYMYECVCIYIYIHRVKERDVIMKGGGVHEGKYHTCIFVQVYVYVWICLYATHPPRTRPHSHDFILYFEP